MDKFEEYRQPWETGPHWELKREFIEKYKSVFPKDRLLCLAQAYFNIELLECSYPEPVMRQINELSKSLNECKRIKDNEKSFVEEHGYKKRKGTCLNESATKKYKCIKFTSESSSATSDSSVKDQTALSSSVDINLLERDILVAFLSSDTSNLHNISKNFDLEVEIFEASDAAVGNQTKEIVKPLCDDSMGKDELSPMLHLCHSPDIEVICKISQALPLKENSVSAFEGVLKKLDIEKEIEYQYTPQKIDERNLVVCKLNIRNTMICVGREKKDKNARNSAILYAYEMLTNLEHFPDITLHALLNNYKTCEQRVQNLINFAKLAVKNSCKRNFKKLQHASATLKNLFFVYVEENNTPLRARYFLCSLIIDKVYICHGKGRNKKKARVDACTNGFQYLSELLTWSQETLMGNTDVSVIYPETTITDISVKSPQKATTNVSVKCPQKATANISVKHSRKAKKNLLLLTDYFEHPVENTCSTLNERLLSNSFSKELVIFNTRDAGHNHLQTASAILIYSLSQCKKGTKIEYYNEENVRCEIYCNGEVLGKGEGSTKQESKENAADNALKYLLNTVYTIKVKNEKGDGFCITRSQVFNTAPEANIIPDSNIGCKMLKKMGWVQGGIGKKEGIVEPIMTDIVRRLHSGLGSKNKDTTQFRSRIDDLLKNYCQTDTTSDLIFSDEFTNVERQTIHSVAHKYKLISRSRGRGDSRQTYISRRFTVPQLLSHLINAGGSVSKYALEDRSY